MDNKIKTREEAWRPKVGVINADMIKLAVSRMLEDDVPGNNVDEEEGYEFHDITHIYLEHLDILHIDHLWIMPLLTVLKLTGNLIEKIENLETLQHLTDLNLSFNKIKIIENLDKLVQLRRLSLFSNQISKIENLDHLTNLKIFSIGENLIDDKLCILQLRKLNLYSLNMAGNPCTKEDSFRNFIAAYIPKLEYYEYKKVSEEEREEGRVIYLSDLEVLERAEKEEENMAATAVGEAKKEEKHLQAFVENMDKNQLFAAMLESDPHGQALLLIGEDVQLIFERFERGIEKCSESIFNFGLEQFEIRQKEIEMYNQGVQDAIVKSQAKQREVIEQFLVSKSEIFVELSELWRGGPRDNESSEENAYEQEVEKAYKMYLSVKNELMSLEFTVSEQLKENFSVFERSLGDMVNSFIETTQGFFTNMREHETVLSEQLGDQANRFFTQLVVRNEDVNSLPMPLRQIMIDREAVTSAIAASHDIHMQMIDSREDELISRTRVWYQKLCHNYEQEEDKRYRGRVNEVLNFIEMQAKDLQQYQLALDDEAIALMGEGEEIAQNN